MGRVHKAMVSGLVITAAVCLAAGGVAYAGNGTRMIGFSSRDAAMAGATTASCEDTACLVRNPAGLTKIGSRIDFEYENIIPRDVSMSTEGIATPPLAISMANRSKIQKSTVQYIPGGNLGASYRIPGTEDRPVVIGCGAFTTAGVAVSYPTSRLNEAFLGALSDGPYDRMVDLRSMRFTPGAGFALTDKLSVGATGNIIIQALKTDLAKTGIGPLFQETTGAGNWDFAPGGGFTVGMLYDCTDRVSLGASYESHGWIGHHYQYKDCLPYIDEPPVINAGISVKPVRQIEVTFDTRYINWTDVKIARVKPDEGGFGWQDQWVFATGTEWSVLNDRLKLRLGYNYGKSPIQPHVVFANALLPVIAEHHLTTGFSWYMTKNLSLDFVWEHHFTGVQADNGAGDIYSVNGVGTKIRGGGEVIGAGIGYKFN